MFFDAALKSKGLLAKWRGGKGYQCLAMSRIASAPTVENLKKANEDLKNAAEFNVGDKRVSINALAIQCLLTLVDIKENIHGYPNKKGDLIQQFLELKNSVRNIDIYGESLASILDYLTNKVKDMDSATLEQLDMIWNELFLIVNIFSL